MPLPPYCNRFDEVGDDLVYYCKRDYRGYYSSNSYQNLPSVTFDEAYHSAKYFVMQNGARYHKFGERNCRGRRIFIERELDI